MTRLALSSLTRLPLSNARTKKKFYHSLNFLPLSVLIYQYVIRGQTVTPNTVTVLHPPPSPVFCPPPILLLVVGAFVLGESQYKSVEHEVITFLIIHCRCGTCGG